jgi:Kdo2-lipid IVA lauroyltransferase/acyltransferase
MPGRQGRGIKERARGRLHRAVSLIIHAEIIGKALCAALLPTPWAVKVMPFSLAARLLPASARRRVIENLEAVFGQAYTEAQKREITRRYFGQFFVYLLDFFLGLRMKASDVGRIFAFEGRENVDEALRQGKGILGVTGHYCWAVRGLLAIGCLGYPLSAVILHAERIPFRRLQWLFRPVLKTVRRRTGVDWIFPGGAVSRVDEKLRNNEAVAFTLDVPRFEEDRGGMRVPFLGGEVTFPAALIDLAIRSEACLLPAFVMPREGSPGFGIRVHPPLIPRTRDEQGVQECLELCSRMLEALIRERPEHWWLWKDLKQFWRPL